MRYLKFTAVGLLFEEEFIIAKVKSNSTLGN
jgi:hypothetical protein